MFKDNFTFKNKNGTTLIDSEPLIFTSNGIVMKDELLH